MTLRRPLPSTLVAALALFGVGCEDTLTQLVVVVRTDLELDALRVHVSPSEAVEAPEPRELAGPLPLSFGVLPPGGDPARRVRIRIEGLSQGAPVVQTSRVSPFLKDQTARLDVFLAASCRNETCLLGQTCDRGKCVSESVDAADLVPVAPGDELPAPGDPDLVPTPSRIDFAGLPQNPNRPEVYLGQVVTTTVTVKNVGAAAVRGLTARIDGEHAAHFDAAPPPEALAAGDALQVSLTYAPTSAGPHAARWVLSAGAVEVEVALSGLAAACPGGGGIADPDGTCRLDCEPGYADADANPANGCECEITNEADLPDPSYVDANCDGVDGDVARGIFVAPPPFGADANPGTRAAPVATFARAFELVSAARAELYVSVGAYPQAVTVPDGVSIYGGYDAANRWARGLVAAPVIEAPGAAVTFGPGRSPRTFAKMHVIARTALEPGVSSVAVTAEGVDGLTLRDATLDAAPGPRGADGTPGARGDDGDPGEVGGDGDQGGAGGQGGLSSCGATGGRGGDGAFDDNDGPPGASVGPADGGEGGIAAVICSSCDWDLCGPFIEPTWGGDGDKGEAGAPGEHAPPLADAAPALIEGRVVTPAGETGTAGTTGGGGAGGGGGGGGPGLCLFEDGGCFEAGGVCDADRGGGGGGGGAGGCFGGGGAGGGGGGASIGLAAAGSTLSLVDVTITTSDGGPGGTGGDGGTGGRGGRGGDFGMYQDDATDGGFGGDGGTGGDGGDGGGGAGGASLCVLALDGAAVEAEGLTCTHGAGGAGGAGGAEGPPGPVGLSADTNEP